MQTKEYKWDLTNKVSTESTEEIDTSQTRRIEEMAKASPGNIVVGLSLKLNDKILVEQERYLEDIK